MKLSDFLLCKDLYCDTLNKISDMLRFWGCFGYETRDVVPVVWESKVFTQNQVMFPWVVGAILL